MSRLRDAGSPWRGGLPWLKAKRLQDVGRTRIEECFLLKDAKEEDAPRKITDH